MAAILLIKATYMPTVLYTIAYPTVAQKPVLGSTKNKKITRVEKIRIHYTMALLEKDGRNGLLGECLLEAFKDEQELPK